MTQRRPPRQGTEPAPVVVQVLASIFGVLLAQALGQTLVAKLLIGALGALITAFLTAPGRRKERRLLAVALFVGMLDGAKKAFAATRRRLLGNGDVRGGTHSGSRAPWRSLRPGGHAVRWLPSAPGWTIAAAMTGLAIGTATTALATGLQPGPRPTTGSGQSAATASSGTTPPSAQTAQGAGGHTDAGVDRHGSGTVRARVWLAAGQPAVGWEVRAYRGAGAPAEANFVDYEYTDRRGSAGFALQAGTYTLLAIGGSNGSARVSQTVTVAAGGAVSRVLNARTGMAVARVWLAAGQPAVGWEVRVYGGAGAPAEANFVDYEYTSQSGSVSFALQAGTYTLLAIGGADGGREAQQTVTVRAGQTTPVRITSHA